MAAGSRDFNAAGYYTVPEITDPVDSAISYGVWMYYDGTVTKGLGVYSNHLWYTYSGNVMADWWGGSQLAGTTTLTSSAWNFVAVSHADGGGATAFKEMFMANGLADVASDVSSSSYGVFANTTAALRIGRDDPFELQFTDKLAHYLVAQSEYDVAEWQELARNPFTRRGIVDCHVPIMGMNGTTELDLSDNAGTVTLTSTEPSVAADGPPVHHFGGIC